MPNSNNESPMKSNYYGIDDRN